MAVVFKYLQKETNIMALFIFYFFIFYFMLLNMKKGFYGRVNVLK